MECRAYSIVEQAAFVLPLVIYVHFWRSPCCSCIYTIHIHIVHIMPRQGRYKRGQQAGQGRIRQGIRRGPQTAICMTFTMTFFERMRRTVQPVEQGREAGKSKVFIKNGTPGRSPTQFSSVQFSAAAQSSGAQLTKTI